MGRTNSSIIVARLLESEGFTDHTAHEVARYSRRITHPLVQARHDRIRREAKELLNKQDAGTRMVIGRFISHQMRIAFDCGLRIGLTAHAVANDKDVDTPEHYSRDDHDMSFWIEKLVDGEWQDANEDFEQNERQAAKECAVIIAMRERRETRVLQGGNVVQHYNARGRKLGGTGTHAHRNNECGTKQKLADADSQETAITETNR